MGELVVGLVAPAPVAGAALSTRHAATPRTIPVRGELLPQAQEKEMALLHRKFKFGSGHDIESIVLRQTDGYDEKDAAKMVDARPSETGLYIELVRLSIVEVDGERVEQPFMDIDRWCTKTRELIMTGYNSLNENDEAEKAVFLSASEDVAPLVERPQPRERTSTQLTTE